MTDSHDAHLAAHAALLKAFPPAMPCPTCRHTGQLVAVALAVGVMAGIALSVVAVYLVLSSAA